MSSDYDANFVEEHVQWSNALHSTIKGRGAYFCGPMARFNLNFEKLRPIAKQAAAEAGLPGACRNPFKSIIVRSVEVLHACDEALAHHRRLRNARPPGAGSPTARCHRLRLHRSARAASFTTAIESMSEG